MKKIIVTGGSGFIGINLVNFLLYKKYFVINIDKLTYASNNYLIRQKYKNKFYKHYKIDISDKKKISTLFKRSKFPSEDKFPGEISNAVVNEY